MRAISVVAMMAAAGGAFLACGGDEKTTPDAFAVTTPAAVLANISASWNQREVARFKASLSPNFVFYFNPHDVGQSVNGYVIPVSWDYPETVDTVRTMFENAYSISLDIPTDSVGTPPANASVWRADNITPYLLLYDVPGEAYTIGGGYCNFEFEKYKGSDGNDYWRLKTWWDFTSSAGRNAAPASLGHVLALYH